MPAEDEQKRQIIQSFTGKRNPTLIRIRGSVLKGLIDFAEIRIPKAAIKARDFGEIEDKYNCTIKGLDDDSYFIFITPKFIKDMKILCSEDEKLTKMLIDWYFDYGISLVKHLLKG